MNKILHGNCLNSLKLLENNSIDAIVTDPPYGLSFMGKKWDYDVPSQEIWEECLRVLKPGGYLLAFAGTRTQHRMAVRIEDAGFEIRDMIAWIYGSGFPKSLNIGKAVDKLEGNEREILDYAIRPDGSKPRVNVTANSAQFGNSDSNDQRKTKGISEWEGWGTALKPALEPVTVARKPLSEKTVAENCLKWGVGGINIDGSRVESSEQIETGRAGRSGISNFNASIGEERETHSGRFPANLIHDGSDEVVSLFPNTGKAGNIRETEGITAGNSMFGIGDLGKRNPKIQGDNGGSASRFFYCAKASKSERNKGCEDLEEKQTVGGGGGIGDYLEDVNSASGKYGSEKAPSKNNHPTVKPIALMEYLVKLVSKEGATVLDPFSGSGSTLIACKNLNRNYIGCELDEEYIKISEARLSAVDNKLFI